ncbi:MAG: HmuY family protein [Polyangiaceae bacterium]|nr:HmuY family protein [Polyangiaceae bacterium]
MKHRTSPSTSRRGSLSSLTLLLVVCAAGAGCEEVPSSAGGGGSGAGGGGVDDGAPIEIDTALGPVFVDLDGPAIVDASAAWELKVDGLDVLTNGGVSGDGASKAFPLDAETWVTDRVPADVPFLVEDKPGGAFISWYAYDGSAHTIYSRYHVIGVRRGDALFKVQVLGFYGEVDGAPVPALYRVRSAVVDAAGPGETTEWLDLDGTAGGSSPTDADPSGCVVLATGERLSLTPAEAAERSDWDLCFRRAEISVNGGDGGPGGVEAVDLQAEATAGETLAEVMELTPESQLASFEAVDFAALTAPALEWRGDGVVSAFTGKWLDRTVDPLAPRELTWLVAGSDGETPFFVVFDSFEGASSNAAGVVHARVKKIGGSLP